MLWRASASVVSNASLERRMWKRFWGMSSPWTKGQLAALRPSLARKLAKVVLPVREGPTRITSASCHISGWTPSSALSAKSLASFTADFSCETIFLDFKSWLPSDNSESAIPTCSLTSATSASAQQQRVTRRCPNEVLVHLVHLVVATVSAPRRKGRRGRVRADAKDEILGDQVGTEGVGSAGSMLKTWSNPKPSNSIPISVQSRGLQWERWIILSVGFNRSLPKRQKKT